jgi:hypothetical protein
MNNTFFTIFTLLIIIGASSCSSSNDYEEPPAIEEKEVFYYWGLKEETNIREAEESVWDKYWTVYRPSIQIISNTVYITSSTGIYSRHIQSKSDSDWKLSAFKDVPVNQFVKKGDSIMATTGYADNQALVFSKDNGISYGPGVPGYLIDETYDGKVSFSSITQNPQNPNSLLAMIFPLGLYKSVDFGKNWTLLSRNIGGFQNWFVGFNPKDTTRIYNTGESSIFESFIYSTVNNGDDWKMIETMRNSCIHHLAFSPENENSIIYSGEYILKKTDDNGKNWSMVLSDEIYFYKTVFDADNPDIVYSSGYTRKPSDIHELSIYRSTDGGSQWNILYQTDLEGEGGLIDFAVHDNKLYLYTYTDGIYVLDTSRIPDINN